MVLLYLLQKKIQPNWTCTKQNYNTTTVPSWKAATKTHLSKSSAKRIQEPLSRAPLYRHEREKLSMKFRWQSSMALIWRVLGGIYIRILRLVRRSWVVVCSISIPSGLCLTNDCKYFRSLVSCVHLQIIPRANRWHILLRKTHLFALSIRNSFHELGVQGNEM
mmetsp:Transcript_38251/g.70174  ORF Transcript_38251/g.70174 Transcript_38251/m.70174 type:complete len:163 (-) Transcript_38251:54-542(-)